MLIALGVVAWIVLAVFALRGAGWAYAVFVILAFVWIPARAGFHLHRPDCEMRLSLDLALFSLTNYKPSLPPVASRYSCDAGATVMRCVARSA